MRLLKKFCVFAVIFSIWLSIPLGVSAAETPEVLPTLPSTAEKSDEEILEDGVFSILLWGNSFSLDAGDSTMCHLMNVLSAMFGPDVEVRIGYLISGNKTFTWHATQIDRQTLPYDFQVDYSGSKKWDTYYGVSAETALKHSDWDVVVMQPYSMEARTGVSLPDSIPEDDDPKFFPMSVSAPYLLDYLASFVPNARVYYYLIWSATDKLERNAGLSEYQIISAFANTALDFRGSKSGKKFLDLIPIGTAVQNARTTYLAKLYYNADLPIVNKETDPQIGLQRDSVHISFYLGRYIALSTLAESVVPHSLRVPGYVFPSIHDTVTLGALPKEYTTIARLAVDAAVQGWKKEQRLSVTDITGFEEDPIFSVADKLQDAVLDIPCAADEESLSRQIREKMLACLGQEYAVDSVEFGEPYVDAQTQSLTVLAKIRYGYSFCSIPVVCKVGSHSYRSFVTDPTCTTIGYTTYTCVCGDSYLSDYMDALGHTVIIDEGVAPTCTSIGFTEERHCERCGLVLQERTELPMTDHSYTAFVTLPSCEKPGFTTYTCQCGDVYISDEIPSVGHTWGQWVETVKPDAVNDGVNTRMCTVCKETEKQVVDNNIFSDVKQDRFEDAILWAYYNKITTGSGDGTTFSPEEACTRKQIVTFLWRAAGEPEPKSMENPFTDVKADRFEKAILWAFYEGITTGTGDGTTFSPENTCTRKQIVTFLWRYNDQPAPESMENKFADVKNDRFAPAILWAAEQGITTGTGDGTTFSPEDPCTRKQIVTFLFRNLSKEE